MAQIRFTSHLQRYFPTLRETAVQGVTVAQLVAELDLIYPGIAGYIVDDQGALRQHVNVFIGETMVRDRTTLADPVTEHDQVFIMQALSGG